MRLLRFFPEIMTFVRGVLQAFRSVVVTLILLVVLLVVFGVIFKSWSEGSEVGSKFFPTVNFSMWSLLLYGILNDPAGTIDEIEQSSQAPAFLFITFVALSTYTVLNLLVGILFDVVNTVSREEKERAFDADLQRELLEILECHDKDDDNHLTIDEFKLLLRNPEVQRTLRRADVDLNQLGLLGDLFFHQAQDPNAPEGEGLAE